MSQQNNHTLERLVFQPDTAYSMQHGINLIVDTIRPTLGPIPRMVAVSQPLDNKPPELLDKGGLIARRITNLPNRHTDVGAMFIRQMLWQLYEEMGDGTATAAVLFQSIYNAGLKYIVSGGNAMRLRSYLQEGLQVIYQELDKLQEPVEGAEQLANLAESICHDAALSAELGEIFDFIGEYSQLDVRRGHKHHHEHEYLKGMYWKQGAVSRQMLKGDKTPDRAVMNNAAILLSDLDIEDVRMLVQVVDSLIRAGARSLMLVGSKFSDDVINFILANKNPEKFRIIAVKAPGMTDHDKTINLKDMSVLTGATPLYKGAGDTLNSMKPSYLGQVKHLWVERTMFGFVSDEKFTPHITEHIADLMMLLEAAKTADEKDALRVRIGKMLGGVAILRIGGSTPDAQIALAKETEKSIRAAMRDGVVPGGGIALAQCKVAIRDALMQAIDTDERAAYRILLDALDEPLHTICINAGFDRAKMAELDHADIGSGLDVRTGNISHMMDTGIYDIASVVKAAIRSAVASAGLALTVDVMVHHKNPLESYTP